MEQRLKKSAISFVLLLAFLLTNVSPVFAAEVSSPEVPIEITEVLTPAKPSEPVAVENPAEDPTELLVEEESETEATEPDKEEPQEPESTAAEEPAKEEPAPPAMDEPANEEPAPPAIEEPTEEAPTLPAVEEPLTEEPAAPVIEEPAPTDEPAPPLVEEPAPTEEPVGEEPVGEQPVPAEPLEVPVKMPMLVAQPDPEILENDITILTVDDGKFYPDDYFMAICAYLDTPSVNNHTRLGKIWVEGGKVYLSVKSTHRIQKLLLNEPISATGTLPYKVYSDGFLIKIDDIAQALDGLQGNTGDAHRTIFQFETSDFNLESINSLIVLGINNSEGGHTVIGTIDFLIPETKLTINKNWIGNRPSNGSEIEFDVYGIVEREVGSDLKVWLKTVTLTYPDASITFNVPIATNIGELYDYYQVAESDDSLENLGFYTISDGISDGTGEYVSDTKCGTTFRNETQAVTITNYSLRDVVANKVWVGGAARPAVTFQLYRKVEGGIGETVGDIVTLDGTVDANELTPWSYTWKGLDTHRESDGKAYIYYVVETTELDDYTPDTTDDLTVTNTYDSPTVDVVAKKVWVGGPVVRPEVTFQLYRKFEGGTAETVGTPVKLDGNVDANELTPWNYTWKSLDTHRDSDGKSYIYYVVETAPIPNYTADAVNDLTVTNTWGGELPNTGTSQSALPIIGAVLALGGVALTLRKRSIR